MDNSKKEYLGLTAASILATTGLLLSAFPLFVNLGPILRNLIGLSALAMIGSALFINRRKGLDEKWRKVNFEIHIVMLILALVLICLFNIRWGF